MKNDGGSAFPVSIGSQVDQHEASRGMSLRDYFAAAALQGRCANPRLQENMEKAEFPAEHAAEKYAEYAYEIADAMLREREK